MTQIQPGMRVDLTARGIPDKPFTWRVAVVSPAGDSRTHSFDVKVFADDSSGALKAGTLTQLQIVIVDRADALLVPAAAVIPRGANSRVFVVVGGRAIAREVSIGATDGTSSEVLGGLTANDFVVVAGQRAIEDGQAIEASVLPVQ